MRVCLARMRPTPQYTLLAPPFATVAPSGYSASIPPLQLCHVFDRLRLYLNRPVGNAALVVWRICFGALMCLEGWGAIMTGWVRTNLVEPVYTFPFLDFEWLAGLAAGPAMYVWFVLLGAAGLAVALGWRYRVSSVTLALLWSGAYFMQKTSYNNHYYLAVLLTWAMVLIPQAADRFSFDARRRGWESSTHGYWITLGARLMLLLVFVYGSVAKFYPGWWRGDFIATSFGAKAHYWLIGPLLQHELFQNFITVSAVFFDALVIPLLWWRPTRRWAFAGLVLFNVFNSIVFRIGIFPYLVLAFTVFFFAPEDIERWLRLPRVATARADASRPWGVLATAAFCLFFCWQALLPLRHHLIPGNVTWTDEGHRLSWRMMLRSKSGSVRLQAVNPVTQEREAVPEYIRLSPKQKFRVATSPDFLYQWVQQLKHYYAEERGWPGVELYVTHSKIYLNGLGPGPLYATDIDLAKVKWNTFGHNHWVLDQPADLYAK